MIQRDPGSRDDLKKLENYILEVFKRFHFRNVFLGMFRYFSIITGVECEGVDPGNGG